MPGVSSRWCSLAAAATLAGCATAGTPPPVKVDLAPARAAVEEARQAGAPDRSPEGFARAETRLKEAEGALAATPSRAADAQRLAELAIVEAGWSARVARHQAEAAKGRAASDSDLSARLRRAEAEQKRLEDRLTLLQRDLEVTETELIRSKARLKGNETKAEASAAIAEARILARRLEQEKGRSGALDRCLDSLGKAEEQLLASNFGAAIFFALKAQDTAVKGTGAAREGVAAGADAPPPKPTYVARSAANIRKGPGANEPVVGKARTGATMTALAVRGDWVKVVHEGTTGWIRRDLLQ